MELFVKWVLKHRGWMSLVSALYDVLVQRRRFHDVEMLRQNVQVRA